MTSKSRAFFIFTKSQFFRYAAALALCGAFITLKFVLHDLSPGHARILLMGVALSSFFWGMGPGVLATTISVIANIFLFLPTDADKTDIWVETISFLTVSTIVVTLMHKLSTARASAQRLADQRAMFLANVSHEIRTPMNSIVGLTDYLAQTKLTNVQHESLELIRKSTESLLRLVSDLLDFSRLSFSKESLRVQHVNLRKNIQGFVTGIQPSAELTGMHIQLVFDSAIPDSILCDWERLRQVLGNFVENALKFSPPGSQTEINVFRASEGRIRFEVKDSGIGISPEDQNRIFDAFVQLDANSTRQYGGTGLGLAICKQIVNAMNGEIGVESHPGKGSTFWFEIPAESPTVSFAHESRGASGGENPAATLAQRSPASLRGCRILLAEDHAVNRRIIERLLTLAGTDIVGVDSGTAALECIGLQNFDIVLLDCHMPGMDGYQAAQIIRARHPHLPIIAMTADSSEESIKKCKRSGFNEVVLKPVGLDRLISMLERWVSVDAHTESHRIYIEKLRMLERETGSEFLVELTQVFLENAPQIQLEICKAIQEEDREAIKNLAHALKSASAAIGARSLVQVCVQLEELAATASFEQLKGLSQNLDQELKRAKGVLESLTPKSDTSVSRTRTSPLPEIQT